MALSNWDTVAFGEDGKSCRGDFKHPRTGVELELYKNWVYVRSEAMWDEQASYFVNNTIAQIEEGTVSLGGWEISAARGSQNSVFLLASYTEKNGEGRYVSRFVGGISGSGYKDRVWEVLTNLGREAEADQYWGEFSKWDGKEHTYNLKNYDTGEEIVFHRESIDGKYDYAADWIGILNSTVNEYIKWVESLTDPDDKSLVEWLNKVKDAEKLRYNQGDAYFADHLGCDLPATEPEKSTAPVINKMIDKINGD